jgi:hypothetical protein
MIWPYPSRRCGLNAGWSVRRQEARPEELAPDETWRLRKLRVIRDQHVFDMIGMIQQESRPAEKRKADEIAFSGQLLDKCNRIACKTPQPPC